MGSNFFKSKKNLVTFILSICIVVAIVATVLLVVLIKSPKPEYVTARKDNFEVYYDKNGIDKGIAIKKYVGTAGNGMINVPETITISGNKYIVTELSDNAFSGVINDELTAIDQLNLPDTIVKIGDNAFEKLLALTTLHIKGTVENYGSNLFKDSGIKNITIDNFTAGYKVDTFNNIVGGLDKLNIGNIVGNINDFSEDFALNFTTKELHLGNGIEDATMFRPIIEKIETLSYDVSTTLFSQNLLNSSQLKNLYVNGSVKNITSETLANVANKAKLTIENIYLGESFDTISAGAFAGFTALKNIYLTRLSYNVNLDALKGVSGVKFNFVANGNVSLTISAGETTALSATFTQSFNEFNKVTAISILNGITEIQSNALANIANEAHVTFATNSTVTEIKAGAFGTKELHFHGPSSGTLYNRLCQSSDFAANVKTYNGEEK